MSVASREGIAVAPPGALDRAGFDRAAVAGEQALGEEEAIWMSPASMKAAKVAVF